MTRNAAKGESSLFKQSPLILTLLRSKNLGPSIVLLLMMIGTALQLHHQGRSWWCVCGTGYVWISSAWGSQTSQAFLDPYSFTHVLHGLLFAGVLALFARRMPVSWQLCLALAAESIWELIENTNSVIDRYREATAALGYHGDTVVNSLGDIACCALGFVIARKLGFIRSLAVFFATEAVLLVLVRDSLILEIVMLLFPIPAIKAWQVAG